MHSIDIPQEYKHAKRVVAMANSNFSKVTKMLGAGLGAVLLALGLGGCGQGDGPDGIANSPATPLPDIPAGFCDPTNFETLCPLPEIINFNGGATVIVDNPNPDTVNDTQRVARMQKFGDQPFGGTRINPIETPVDFSAGEVYKIKVWSERAVPVTFKLEETTDGTLGVERVATHSGGSVWEELCFDFTGSTVNTIGLTIIFDNGVLGAAIDGVFSGDWTFYYDEITQVESCDGGSPSAIDPEASLFVTSGDPNLLIPDDYAEITPFGSGSVIDQFYADDTSFSPVISVFSGTGYGANISQIGFVGFQAGFLGAYETINFKVKGLPNQVVFVKLFDGVDVLRINLTSSAYSTALFDGWFQVSIPVSAYSGVENATGIVLESDDTALMQFRMLLTDVGFSGSGSNPPPPPFDSGLLSNGDFESGATPWLAGVTNPIDPANVIDDAGNQVFFVDVTAAGNPFDVNLSQKLAITPDETYTLSFMARSNVARSIVAGIGLSGGSFANTVESVDLTTDWQMFSLELTATGFGDADSRVLFDLGAEVGEVYIDDVSLVVSTSPPPPPFDSGLLSNGDFESGATPWLAGVANPIDPANVIDDAGNQVFFVDVTAAGNPFDVNLSQKLAITPDETYTLSFMARSNVARSIVAGIGLSGGSFANTVQTVDLTTDWQMFSLELTATGFGDADSRVLFDLGAEVGEVYIDEVSLVVSTGGGGGAGGAGDLAVNGDFEAGDFSGWQQFVNSGVQMISTDTSPTGGMFSGAISANVAPGSGGTTEIKQANLGAGTLALGDVLTITFDVKGSFGPGGQLNVLSFTEISGGGADLSDQTVIAGGVDDWTTQTYDVTLSGADAGGGFSLAFNAVCGAVPDCIANVFIDNVSIVTN